MNSQSRRPSAPAVDVSQGNCWWRASFLGCWAAHWDLLLAFAALRVLSTIGPPASPRLHEITLNPTVLVFTLVLSLSSALFRQHSVARFGSRRLALTLRAGGRGSNDSQERNRARNILVVVQVAPRTDSACGLGADGSDVSRVTNCPTWLYRP
jgi:hypothetical protein